jgi:hypothetical protein
MPFLFSLFLFFSFEKGRKIERKVKEVNSRKKKEIGIGKGASTIPSVKLKPKHI